MATLQKRISRGRTYWSIVESRRINGKPRPIILEYLGSADSLCKRLKEGIPKKVRSFSHGTVAVMLDIAEELQIVETINKHIEHKQIRDGFTVGGSLLLDAIGRICQPTSKRNWYEGWARGTSLGYLTRMSLDKLDSQHFWDQMEMLSPDAIPLIEEEVVNMLIERQGITLDTFLCDTTNFFTYIDTTNERCTLAHRGKNKHKRMDLRQLGLLLLVARHDQIPIFHKLYQGNLSGRTVFKEAFKKVLNRFKAIAGSLEDITVVFDQGNNSRKTLMEVNSNIHFVGALSPHHHKDLIEDANRSMTVKEVNGHQVENYRVRTNIWGLDLTAVVYISEKLRQGQVRGVEQNLKKTFARLEELRDKIKTPTLRGKKRTQEGLENKIRTMIASYVPEGVIEFELKHLKKDAFELDFRIDKEVFNRLKDKSFGRRILITNRHEWDTEEIISSYWSQARVEGVFKNMKNPFHLALRPQYHWTDQKIEVHGFICVLAFLLFSVAFKRAKECAGFKGSPHTLLEKLSAIRLATFTDSPGEKTKGRYKTSYCLEDMDEDISLLAEGMGLIRHKLKTNIPFSVYN